MGWGKTAIQNRRGLVHRAVKKTPAEKAPLKRKMIALMMKAVQGEKKLIPKMRKMEAVKVPRKPVQTMGQKQVLEPVQTMELRSDLKMNRKMIWKTADQRKQTTNLQKKQIKTVEILKKQTRSQRLAVVRFQIRPLDLIKWKMAGRAFLKKNQMQRKLQVKLRM